MGFTATGEAKSSPRTAERHAHLAPVATPADPLFVATSVEWLLDASIPVEIRILCQLILAKAIQEAREEGRDFTTLGHGEATVKINVAWIIVMTGWPKGKAENVRAEAVEKGYLSVSGSSRAGYRYTIMLSLRTHRANIDVPPAKSMFATERNTPNPKPRSQLELAEVGAALQPPSDMKRWSRADREFYSRSSGAIRAVYSRLSGAERKLFSRLSGANQELYSRSPGASAELLARLSGANDELYSRRSGAKNGLYKVRARSQEPQNYYKQLLADAATPEIRSQLLLLAQKREEDTEGDSATFVQALGRIVETLRDLCEDDLERVRATLTRVINDERVTSHENPIALMLRGICHKPRFLLTTRRMGKTPDERAYCLLPTPVQEILLENLASGRLTAEWCRERDISDGARRFAIAIVESGGDKGNVSVISPIATERAAEEESSVSDAPLCDELAKRDPDEYRRRLEGILPLIDLPPMIRERSLDHPMLLGMCRARLKRELGGDP